MLIMKKIIKVDVRDKNDKLILSDVNFDFPKNYAGNAHEQLLIIKGENLPELAKGTYLSIIISYLTGDRISYPTEVAICTDKQLNVYIGAGEKKLEERRRFFKLATNVLAEVTFFTRDKEMQTLENPLKVLIKNINIGGVFFRTAYEFEMGDELMMVIQLGNDQLETVAQILRIHYTEDEGSEGKRVVEGYGCRFLGITHAQEAIISRYIFNYQLMHKDAIDGPARG